MNKQLKLKQGVLYRKTTQINDQTKFQFILPSEHWKRAIEGSHDWVGYHGKDRTLKLLRNRFFCPGIKVEIWSYINRCPRCLRRKFQPDIVPLVNIETTKTLELIHLNYLQTQQSKENMDNVLSVTDHFTRYAQAFPSKSHTAIATATLLWNNFLVHYGFPSKLFQIKAAI